MIVLRISTLAKATSMPKSYPPEQDTWLDEEISALVEAVASDANGHTAHPRWADDKRTLRSRAARGLPKTLPLRRRVLWSAVLRNVRVGLRRRGTVIVSLAVPVGLGVLIGWLVVTLTKP
jgi:hypothetical protein